MSWQPPSEDWQSALEQPEDWQKQLRRGARSQTPVWRSPEPAPASEAPVSPPEAPAEPPPARPERRWAPAPPTAHTLATTAPGAGAALALGIVSLWIWLLGPFAWYQGARARRAVRRSGGQLGGYGVASFGMVLGILETVAMILITALIVIGILVTIGEEAS